MRKLRREAVAGQPEVDQAPAETGNATVERLMHLLFKQPMTDKVFTYMAKLPTAQKTEILYTFCKKLSAPPEAISRVIAKIKN